MRDLTLQSPVIRSYLWMYRTECVWRIRIKGRLRVRARGSSERGDKIIRRGEKRRRKKKISKEDE